LIQSGRMLKEHHAGAGAGRIQFTVKRTMPAAFERFQNSLDELENNVFQAQVVLRRDLAVLQADRQKRELAEAAERQRQLAAASSAKQKPPVKMEPPRPAAVAPAVPPQAPEADMGIKPVQPDAPPAPLKRETEEAPNPKPAATASVALPPATPPVDDAPAQDSEFDFEAMFGDSLDDIKGEGEGDASNPQVDMDMDTSGPDLNFTLDDSAPSLLRGLEDFAKSTNVDAVAAGQANPNSDLDLAMPDIPDMPTSQPSEKPGQLVEQPSAAKPADPTTSEQVTDNTHLLDTMNADDLDDLFNIDYENPEATQFDDAFFGFGES
ncbi:hypothetical protein K505DRAFT_330329, partial [Melanomma pulvis-pyrius CBS 109.77]